MGYLDWNKLSESTERIKAREFMAQFPDWEQYGEIIFRILNENPYLPYEEAYMLAKKGVKMGRINIGGVEFDPSNISGAKLAEIGRWAVSGKRIADDTIKEGDYTHMGWLDMRIEEVCRKGRL